MIVELAAGRNTGMDNANEKAASRPPVAQKAACDSDDVFREASGCFTEHIVWKTMKVRTKRIPT